MEQIQKENKGKIVLYQQGTAMKLDVWLEKETVWLTQEQVVCANFAHTT